MFLISALVIAAIGLPMGLAMSLVTHDLMRLVELTSAGTGAAFLVLVLAWRWAMKHEAASIEAKTPWMAAAATIVPNLDAWGVLRGEVAAPGAEEPASAASETVSPAAT